MESAKAVKKSAWRRGLLLVGLGVVSAGSVAGVSYALTSNTAAPRSAASSGSAGQSSNGLGQIRRAAVRKVLERAVSGQIELKTKNGFVTVDFDRGVVSSISSSSVSILRADSKTVTEAITSSTHMPKRGTPAKGQQIVVVSENGNALRIFDLGAASSATTGAGTGTSSSSTTSNS